MEFLVIEYPLIKDLEIYYFKEGIEVTESGQEYEVSSGSNFNCWKSMAFGI
jgi:hypothetical protein